MCVIVCDCVSVQYIRFCMCVHVVYVLWLFVHCDVLCALIVFAACCVVFGRALYYVVLCVLCLCDATCGCVVCIRFECVLRMLSVYCVCVCMMCVCIGYACVCVVCMF